MSEVRIESLQVYPVKSCRGIALERSQVLTEGLRHDREWMVVDANGRFLTQRELPAMARISTRFDGDMLALSALGHGSVRVPLRYADAPTVPVRCWGHAAQALDCGTEAAGWLGDVLRTSARLVRFSRHDERICNPKWTGEVRARTKFSDGYPILVLGAASVEDLAQRMGVSRTALSRDRFRANLVVSGLPAYEEDHVDVLEADGLALKLVKPCARCTIPDLDPVTGQPDGPSPLLALQAYRIDTRAEGAVLGMNAVVLSGAGAELTAGQQLTAQYRFGS